MSAAVTAVLRGGGKEACISRLGVFAGRSGARKSSQRAPYQVSTVACRRKGGSVVLGRTQALPQSGAASAASFSKGKTKGFHRGKPAPQGRHEGGSSIPSSQKEKLALAKSTKHPVWRKRCAAALGLGRQAGRQGGAPLQARTTPGTPPRPRAPRHSRLQSSSLPQLC